MYLDRIYNLSSTTGLNDFILISGPTGYRSFSTFGDNVQAAYVAAHPTLNEWEVGTGRVQISGGTTTLERETILASSNSGNKVNFSAGRKELRNTLPASMAAAFANVIDNAILADGSIPFAANQSLGSNRLTNVANPVNAQDADTKAARDAAISAAVSGSGDVDGPDSSIDNAAAVFDGTTGKLLRSSPTVVYHPVASDAEDKLELGATFKDFRTAADGATVTFDFDLADQWKVTFAGNRTLAFTHASVNQTVRILRYQDATGDRTPTWWSNIEWHNGLAPIEDPRANGWSMTDLVCTGLDSYGVPNWKEVCRSTSAPRRSIVSATDGATITFDLRVSPRRKVTLGGNRTLALTAGSYYADQPFAIKLTQDGTGSRTVTWWSGIKWPGGTAPTLTTTAGKSDWFAFVCTDASGSPKFDCLGMSLNLDA